MTVSELIDELQKVTDKDVPVAIWDSNAEYPYPDIRIVDEPDEFEGYVIISK